LIRQDTGFHRYDDIAGWAKLSLSYGDAGAEFVPKEELPDRRLDKFNVSYIYLNKTLNYRTLFNPYQSRYLPPPHPVPHFKEK
jgi:hypothetical protein